MSGLYPKIYTLVREIPAGRVSTYGRVGLAAGCSARTVGFAMAALPPGSDVPWQRVVNARGMVSQRHAGDGSIFQRDLLESEGIEFNAIGRIDFERYEYRFV